MSQSATVAVDVLLGLGLAAETVCCVGVVLAVGALNRLHYAGAASTLGPVFFAAAVLVAQGLSGAGVLTLLTVGFLLISGPVLVTATARVAQQHDALAGENVEVDG